MAGLPLAACAAVAFYLCLLASSSSAATGAGRDGRTAYHFQPAKNWQNDPNGPMYYNGLYHLFYQYNPNGATWDIGNLSWGHSVSGDLVNWATLETALDPTASFDINGCWSGSATILPSGTPAILYTGIDANGSQVQNVAFPKNPADPLLREWVKPDYNPVIPHPDDVPDDRFRDPSTAWLGRDGLWRVVVSADLDSVGPSTLVYRSNQTSELRNWERAAAPLHSSNASGMVECPDLFPVKEKGTDGLDTSASGLGVKHVLKLSVMDTLQDYYMVGAYDDAAAAFVPDEPERGGDVRNWRRLDYGHVYASKSFFDARQNRRVLWAWVNESDSQANDIARGWSGIQTFPRKVWLDKAGKQLLQQPVEEIESLRRTLVGVRKTVLNAGATNEIFGVGGSQVDVEVSFKIQSLETAEVISDATELLDPQRLCGEKGASVPGGVGPFGLVVMASADVEEHTAVFFRVFQYNATYKVLMCTDLTRSSTKLGVYKPAYGGFVDVDVEEHKKIKLRTLIDHSVVESFGAGGRAVITARVYPEHTATNSSHLFVFNNGTDAVRVSKLRAWELAPASVNAGDNGLILSELLKRQSESY